MTESYSFHFVNPPILPQVWPVIANMLQESPETWSQFETLESIKDHLEKEHLILGVTHKGPEIVFALIMSIRVYSIARTLHLVWCYGPGLDEHIEGTLSAVERFAEINNCDFVSVEGRFGWQDKLAKYGYGDPKVVVRKRVNKNRMH